MSNIGSHCLSHTETAFPGGQHQSSPGDTATIKRSFMAYAEAFQTLNPRAMLRLVHLPLVLFDGRELRVLSSPAEVEATFTAVMRGLALRGYARSDIEELWVYPMGRAALVSVARARYTAAGDEIDCLGETYTLLRNADDQWLVAIAVMHDAACLLRASQRGRRG